MKIIEYGGFIPSVNNREVSRQRKGNERENDSTELDQQSEV